MLQAAEPSHMRCFFIEHNCVICIIASGPRASGKLEAGGHARRWLMIGKGPLSHWTVTIARPQLRRSKECFQANKSTPVFKSISDERDEEEEEGERGGGVGGS